MKELKQIKTNECAVALLESVLYQSIEDAVRITFIADEFLNGKRVEMIRLDNDITLENIGDCLWQLLNIYSFLHTAPYHLQPGIKKFNDFMKIIETKSPNVSRETFEYIRGYYGKLFNKQNNQ